MTFGANWAGADPLAHTVHIWPSQALIDRSWEWPERWHAAYEQAASEIGRAVGVCVLGGLPVIDQPIELELRFGCITFSVSVWGTSIYISITAFEGPDGPDPDGGCHQPRTADGLGFGLRGTGKYCQVVTFYGYMPPLPTGYQSLPGAVCQALSGICGKVFARRGLKFMNGENDIDRVSNITGRFQAFRAGKLNDAVPAVPGEKVLKRRHIDRTVPVPMTDVASSTRLPVANRALLRSGPKGKAPRSCLTGVSRNSRIDMAGLGNAVFGQMSRFRDCGFEIKALSLDRTRSQYLH